MIKTILIAPIITEQSMVFVKQGKFSFLVAKGIDKKTIKKAVQDTFSVDVTSVDTLMQKGKSQKVGVRRVKKDTVAYKKAIVTLKTGQKIDIFDLGV